MQDLKDALSRQVIVEDEQLESLRKNLAHTKELIKVADEKLAAAKAEEQKELDQYREEAERLELRLREIREITSKAANAVYFAANSRVEIDNQLRNIRKDIDFRIANGALFKAAKEEIETFDYNTASAFLEIIDTNTLRVTTYTVGTAQRFGVEFFTKPFRLMQKNTGLLSSRVYEALKITARWDTQRYGAVLLLQAAVIDSARHIRDYQHPHIGSGGAICSGEEATRISNALLSGNVLSAITSICGALRVVNPLSAYVAMWSADPLGPWDRLVCPECNRLGIFDYALCSHTKVSTFCAICLEEKPITHCGACATCCSKSHAFSLQALETNSGLNKSGCVWRVR